MDWQLVKRDDPGQDSDMPFISITGERFSFNTMFVRKADVGPEYWVTIYVKPEEFKIGFEFHKDKMANSFTLSSHRKALFCSARGTMMKHPWIRNVTKLPLKDKRFKPSKEGKLWVIQLCPAFEYHKTRKSQDIPSNICGIYRYTRENGEIVYIGRGEIKKRLNLPERQDWDFDIIEYSIIENSDQQLKWEDYWITRYKEEHNGKLPFYNKISGVSLKEKN